MQTGIETEQLVENIAQLRALPDGIHYDVRGYGNRAQIQFQANSLDQVEVIQAVCGTPDTAWWSERRWTTAGWATGRIQGIVSDRLSILIYAIPADVDISGVARPSRWARGTWIPMLNASGATGRRPPMPINDRVYIVLRAGMQNTITVEVNADPDLPEAMRTLLLALRNMPTGERMARALRVLYRGAFVVRDVWPCQPVDRAWPIIQVDWGEGEIILSVDTLCACWVFIGEAQVRRATMLSWGTLHEHGTALS